MKILAGENELINSVKKLLGTEVEELVKKRIEEFSAYKNGSATSIFKELCFCILTANFSAEKSIEIQKALNDSFLVLPERALAEKLKKLGHRYPSSRAKYIVEARKIVHKLPTILNSFRDEKTLREWLVKNIKGMGYKEASHFLRNIGYKNLAIIDYHILDLLVKYGLIERPKTLTRKRYLEIEKILRSLAEKIGITVAELDLYLWYLETGKVLK